MHSGCCEMDDAAVLDNLVNASGGSSGRIVDGWAGTHFTRSAGEREKKASDLWHVKRLVSTYSIESTARWFYRARVGTYVDSNKSFSA